jgi:hypothetical protein
MGKFDKRKSTGKIKQNIGGKQKKIKANKIENKENN